MRKSVEIESVSGPLRLNCEKPRKVNGEARENQGILKALSKGNQVRGVLLCGLI